MELIGMTSSSSLPSKKFIDLLLFTFIFIHHFQTVKHCSSVSMNHNQMSYHCMKSEFLCSLWQHKESFMPFMSNCKWGFYVFVP